MAEDTKRLADRIWEPRNSSSKVFGTDSVVYFLDQKKGDYCITVKYRKSETGGPIEIPIPLDNLDLTPLQKLELARGLVTQGFLENIERQEKKLKHYVTNLENKDEAIALLEEYRKERNTIVDEYKVLPCISYFFKDNSFLQPILGIPRQDKLDAVDEITKWLNEAKTAKSMPVLNLTPQHIKALTDKNLGDKIEEIRKLDAEFDAAFAAAIVRSQLSVSKSFSIN